MTLNRRTFLAGTGAASVLSAPMVRAAGHGKPRVVVVGGGAGGAGVHAHHGGWRGWRALYRT